MNEIPCILEQPVPIKISERSETNSIASMEPWMVGPFNFTANLRYHSMRLFLAAFCLTGVFSSSPIFAQNDEPLTGGTGSPGHARFEVSPAHEYLVARARAETMHREAIMKQHDWMGFNFARPTINADIFYNANPPLRIRRF